ncbi:hypothetical protein FWH09_00090 [Candidatus Saccharibacteria bacterium]|nr:hypothetical protein [Candidatus Saccharibacteria bacterium]
MEGPGANIDITYDKTFYSFGAVVKHIIINLLRFDDDISLMDVPFLVAARARLLPR